MANALPPRDRRSLRLADCVNDVCPWTGKAVVPEALALYRGRVVGFSNSAERDRFVAATLILDHAIQGECDRVQAALMRN